MKVLTLIPVYNENERITPLIKKVRRYCKEVLIINDGSTDNTIHQLNKLKGVHILSNSKNLGKGNSIRKGFKFALEHEFDVVILMDGDGQHNPSELKKFIERIKYSDIVIGNRMDYCKKMPFIRYFVNIFDSFIVSKIINYQIKDVHCGYRALKSDLIKKLNLKSERYEIEAEMILQANKNKAKIDNLNIECIYSGQKSSINSITDTFRFIKLLLSRI